MDKMTDKGDWVLVPREPDSDMLDAAIDAHIGFGGEDEVDDVWAAMLASAPQPPAEAQAQGGGDAELRHMVAKLAAHVRPTCGELWAEAERLLNRTSPLSAPAAQGGGEVYGYEHNGRYWSRDGATPWVIHHAVPLYTAPPSAPVGVEGLVKSWERSALVDALTEGERAVLRNCTRALRALAQQPAAVDGAMVAIKSAIAELDALRNAMFKTYAAAANGADKAKLIRLIEAERDAYEAHYSLPKLQAALAAQPGGVG